MAKKQKEGPVADDSTGKIKVKAKKEKQPDGNETKGNVTKVKEKMKMKPIVEEETMTKVDLNKETEKIEDTPVVEKEQVEVKEVEKPVEETPTLEEITEETEEKPIEQETQEVADEVNEAMKEAEETGTPLPENIQKVIDFMDETGGSLEEYVKLNQDYSSLDDISLLREYYKQTKPHLTDDEVSFLMEDKFSIDEDNDEERDIKRKQLALKAQVAGAKTHLDGLKSKYYEEIKAGSKLTGEQQKAVEFFNRYNEELETTTKANEAAKSNFLKRTDKVFNNNFKGFEYNVGQKKFRFNVKNSEKVKESQSDINNFIKKFLGKDNSIEDANGYHKSLFTAMNPDAVANHFYEQGKADALKESIAKSKNVSMDPRTENTNVINTSGFSVRAVPGDSVSDFKVRIKK